jgi:hypothetical protein
MDYDGSIATSYRKNTALTTAATTDLIAAPGSGITRNVKTINVRNKDASVTQTITVQHTDGTTVVELFKGSISPGQVLQYIDGFGWDIAAGSPSVFPQVFPPVQLTTTGLQNIASKVIPANTVINDRAVRMSLNGTHWPAVAGQYRFVILWGGAIQYDVTTSGLVANATYRGPWDFRFTLSDVGSNHQALNGIFLLNDANSSSGMYGGAQRTATSGEFAVDSIGVDATQAQTLAVQVDILAAGTNRDLKMNTGIVELLG